MKFQTKMLFGVVVLILGIPFMAGAAPIGTFSSDLSSSQTFYGDGAVYGDGYLQAPAANFQGTTCLECHQGLFGIPDKKSYLRTGHGNMVKKVTSPPQSWKGVGEQPHSAANPFAQVIDQTIGKVDLGGFCDVGGFEGQFDKAECEDNTACTLAASDFPSPAYKKDTCEAAGGEWRKGVWTPASRLVDILYFVGDWMGSAAGLVDTAITGPSLPADKILMADGRTYGTCGSCHNAGYKANDYTRPQPFADYSNLPRSAAAGVGGSWVLDGIQCERCHDATNHFASPFTVTVPRGASSTAVCSQCHIRPAGWEGLANNPKAATQPTAYPIGASATNFGGHLIGKQFLNSPHGRFTGAYGQIATKDLYDSHFSDGDCSIPGEFLSRTTCQGAGGTWTSIQGGCTTCHDVHQSTLPQAKVNFGAEPMKRECGIACHASRADFTKINHTSGAGTPMEGGTEAACVTCHMPKPLQPDGSLGLSVHVFRISTDPNYTTFPKQVEEVWTPGICNDPSYTTRDACVAAGKTWAGVASSSPEADFANAVWVDLDLACGQCHGGGVDGTGAKVLPMSKQQLAKYAKGMHAAINQNTGPNVAMAAAPTVNSRKVSFQDNSKDAQDSQSDLLITVNWGDRKVSKGKAGATFSHTYKAGGTFSIIHSVKDSAGLISSETLSVYVVGKKYKAARK